MSPEQLLGQEVTPRSDIYSLGCVLYEMLAGRPPFNDKNTATLIMRQLQDLPESDGFSARTTAILGKCLGKVVFYRAESAATLLKMLDDKSTTPAFELNLSQLVCYVIAFVNIMATAIPTEISLFPLCLLWLLWFSDFAINCWKPHCSREQRQVEFRWFFLLFCFGMAVVLRAMFGAIVAPLAYCLLLLPIVLYSMRAQEFYLSLTNRLNDQNRKAFFARQRRGKSSLELTDCLPSSVRYWLPFFCVIQMVGLTLLPFDLILPNAVDLLRADHFSMIFFGALISLFLLAIGLSWLKPYFQAGHKLSVWIKVIAFNLLCCIMMHTAFIYFPLQSLVFKVLHKSQSVGDQRAFLKEVASYPDDYFGLEAKSLATKYFNDDINKSAKVELCNQIIASKSKFKNWCLADAYVYKLKNSDLTSGDRQQWLNLWDIADKEVQQANGEHGFMSSERSVNLQRYELFQQALQLNALDRAEKTLDAIEARLLCQLDVKGHKPVGLMLVHPTVPIVPKSRFDARNKELTELYPAEIKTLGDEQILLGDLNCTPWSPYFDKLLAKGHLKDSERGFGFTPSWPTKMFLFVPLRPFLPIDHVLVSQGIVVKERRLLGEVGSDHLPVLVRLKLTE